MEEQGFSEQYVLRQLEAADYHKGFFEVLEQLTQADKPPEDVFLERLRYIQEREDTYVVLVAEDRKRNTIVGSGTLFIEKKFIRSLGSVGHIEDVVVDSEERGGGVGKCLVVRLLEASKERGCYKTILACSDENEEFYVRCGMERKEIEMAKYN
jgi:glucosamine-phosphate N-acetyltransferase